VNASNDERERNLGAIADIPLRAAGFVHQYRDDVSAFSTLVIAIFTAVLGLFTISLARSTRKASIAAQDSSKALLASERGTIIEVIRQLNFERAYWAGRYNNSPTMPPTQVDLEITIWLKNYGRTPATIYDIYLDLKIAERAPKDPIFPSDNLVLSEPTISQDDERGPIRTVRPTDVSWEMSRKLVEGTLGIYFIGRIEYKDVFGIFWTREFVAKYDRALKAFKMLSESTKSS
jgi:hypothetical protein